MLNNYIENKYLEKYASEMEKEAGLLGKLALTGLMAGAGAGAGILAYKKGLPSLVKYFGTEGGEQALGKGVSFLKEKGLWQPKSFPIGASDVLNFAHKAVDPKNPWASKYKDNEAIQKGLNAISKHYNDPIVDV